MEKESLVANNNEAESKEIKQDFLIRNLASLLKSNKLPVEIIEQKAKELNIEVYDLCYEVLIESDLGDVFFEYYKKFGKITFDEQERLLFSFFEKIQQEQEPENVTEEVQPASADEKQIVNEEVAEKPIQQIEIEEPAKIETIPKPEKKNWREVKRETEVMAVEDLDGSIRTFEKHVKKLGVAEKDSSGRWIWKGGNKKLVFLGDILGDRSMDGTEIASIIGDLNAQAEKQEGQVDHLCGNHEMEFIHFLCQDVDDYAKNNSSHFTRQSIGVWELAKFDPDPSSELKGIKPLVKNGPEEVKKEFKKNEDKLWVELYEKIPEILKTMRTDQEGRVILEKICNLKVAVIHDDTLFCHTDPTKKIINDLTEGGNITRRVAEINKIFQDNLRSVLFEDGEFDNDFYNLEKIYLHADNREYFVEEETFENLAGNLLSNILEDLYKKKKIKFKKEAEDSLREHGFIGSSGKWENLLTHHLESLNFDVSGLEENINNWKRVNKIGGEYLGIVVKILEASKNEKNRKSKNEITNFFDLLQREIEGSILDDIEKIKNSGINAIIHGHSPRRDDRYHDKNNLIIVSPHADFGEEKGILTIHKNGKINLIGKDFRE